MPTTTLTTHDDRLELELDERGAGRPVLVLHGGGGPATVAPLTAGLAPRHHVLTPTHPGWQGTPRPTWLASIADLAVLYLELLAQRELRDVLLVGSSIGGWIAAEMATRDDDGRVGGLVLLDAMGIDVPGEPIADVFGMSPQELTRRSFHDTERFAIDPTAMAPEQLAVQGANMASLRVLAGDPYMHDPTLRGRLADVRVPALVVWGESDGIAGPGYGRAYADLLPDSRFELVAEAGHLPQLEQPAATLALLAGARPAC